MMTILVVELHSQARAIRDCQLVSLYLDATGCRLKCKIDASIKIDMRDDWRSQCYVCPCCNPDRSFCHAPDHTCLLYTSDAADDLLCVDLGGRRIIKKKTSYIETWE